MADKPYKMEDVYIPVVEFSDYLKSHHRELMGNDSKFAGFVGDRLSSATESNDVFCFDLVLSPARMIAYVTYLEKLCRHLNIHIVSFDNRQDLVLREYKPGDPTLKNLRIDNHRRNKAIITFAPNPQ